MLLLLQPELTELVNCNGIWERELQKERRRVDRGQREGGGKQKQNGQRINKRRGSDFSGDTISLKPPTVPRRDATFIVRLAVVALVVVVAVFVAVVLLVVCHQRENTCMYIE